MHPAHPFFAAILSTLLVLANADTQHSGTKKNRLKVPTVAVEMGANTKNGLYFPSLFSAEKKTTVMERIGLVSPRMLSKPFRPEEVVNVTSGNYVSTKHLEEGQVAGSNGAGPCIGVIVSLVFDGVVRKVTVFHFGATDHPYKTLSRMGPFPKGSHVAIFGGENSNESNVTLESVMKYLQKYGSPKGSDPSSPLIVDGYSNTEGLWIDHKGQYVVYRTDKTSEDLGSQ